MSNIKLINGDCIETMSQLPATSVSAIITDPPAGISFMNKKWDDYGELQGFQEFIKMDLKLLKGAI